MCYHFFLSKFYEWEQFTANVLFKDAPNRTMSLSQFLTVASSFIFYFIGTNQCASNPCVNGNCRNDGDSYQCQCKTGYEGRNCEKSKSIPLEPHCKNIIYVFLKQGHRGCGRFNKVVCYEFLKSILYVAKLNDKLFFISKTLMIVQRNHANMEHVLIK